MGKRAMRIWHVLVVFLAYRLLCVVNLLQAQLLDQQDFEILASVKNTLFDLPGGSFFSTWEFAVNVDPCESFAGVECITVDGVNRVGSLVLGPQSAGAPGLSGTLTPSLGSLVYLTQLTISAGEVQGLIPYSLGNLQNLRVFSCNRNQLSGSIPGSFGNLRNLELLQLSINGLDGSIPWEIGQLPGLKILILSDNKLSGSIPSFSSSSALTHLDLRNNELSGRFPSLPSSLQYLSLTRNMLTGWLGGLVMLSRLIYLDCSFNQFTGIIPGPLFTFQLSYLMLNHNFLSGGVSVTAPININYVDLSYNHLEGTISPFLSGAQSLFLNNNNFVGAIPEVFVRQMESAALQSLYLQHNFLSDWGALGNSSLPSSVAVCVQYNCMMPPPQSLCPKRIAGAAARPGYECLKVTGYSRFGSRAQSLIP